MQFLVITSVLSLIVSCVAALPTLNRNNRGVSVVTSSSWYSPDFASGGPLTLNGYQCFKGKYPSFSQWPSFSKLFQRNAVLMDQFSPGASGLIRDAIKQVSQETHVDARLILAVMMQESWGNLNVHCTGDNDCGLMQASGSTDYDGTRDSIYRMIRAGVAPIGTDSNGNPYVGLVYYLEEAPKLPYYNINDPGNPYQALRCYNSGRIVPGAGLDVEYGWVNGAERIEGNPYVNDIANRLVGWTGYAEDNQGCKISATCSAGEPGLFLRPASSCY